MAIPNIVIGCIVICLSFVFYIYTFSFPDVSQGYTNPATVPIIYSILLAILGFILIIKGWNERKGTQTKSDRQRQNKLVFVFMGVFIIYILGVIYLGFYLSTFLFLVTCLIMTRVKKIIWLIGIPIRAIMFVYIIFGKLLRIVLPTGFF
ncbi:tripartite tricarboxylate transporter TctB family protein [Alkalihalobacillus oceani]|uniref:Tripartite tricarboxylate transporter TctB family protein n=1 Tax=Halalkalibacter oceani TaxID=1653776 RepID=A0A9X2DU83_9BACI|nr:tripartite tricarboxylate transporter TctB family protein [Halalkalibacter oceani]MCM3716507.1 tripartite tricarboxylate transporter TctB family protein [Halalkalibacter oceani]